MSRQTMLQKLLRYPHQAVFDTSPDGEWAFSLTHPDGLRWQVHDGLLLVETGLHQHFAYELHRYTIGSLINRMRADGIVCHNVSPRFFGRSAGVLMPGSGGPEDRLMAHRSLIWSLFGAYALELGIAKAQVKEALKQMIIWQAEGRWLDLWGDLYGVLREEGEQDSAYQDRIPQEAFRLRLNKYAIEQAVLELTGQRISIRETWPEMFRLDHSRLSGTHRLVNDERWRYCYIEPVAHELVDWSKVMPVIMRNKAAGVIVLPPAVELSVWVEAMLKGEISFGTLVEHAAWVRQIAEFRVDYLRLDITQPHRNWRLTMDAETSVSNYVSDRTWENIEHWDGETWGGIGVAQDVLGYIVHASDTETHWLVAANSPVHTDDADFIAETRVSANFPPTWESSGSWVDNDNSWDSDVGGPVPFSVMVSMEVESNEEEFLLAVDNLHYYVHTTLPADIT